MIDNSTSPRNNPYIAGSPIKGQEMFFGRDDIFEKVRTHLVGEHQDNPIVIYGQRRTGKTSVLYQMERRLNEYAREERYVAVLVDLQGFALKSMDDFLLELAYAIRRELRPAYKLQRPDKRAFKSDARQAFDDHFLPIVQTAIGERRLLLMFDEAIRFQEAVAQDKLSSEVFDYLRSLMQHEGNISFIFSLGSKIDALLREYTVMFNVAFSLHVSFLNDKAARSLVTEPVADLYTFDEEAIKHLLALTSRHAFFTQVICHALFIRWEQERLTRITSADIDAVLEEATNMTVVNLKYVWDEATPVEKFVLAAMSEMQSDKINASTLLHHLEQADIYLRSNEIRAALRELKQREVINSATDPHFYVVLVRRWLRREKPLTLARDELHEHLPELPLAVQQTKQAHQYRARNQDDLALQAYHKALRDNPHYVPAVLGQGEIFITRHNWPQAIKRFEQVMKLEPKHSEAPHRLIQAHLAQAEHLLDQGQTEQAKSQYEAVSTLDAQNREATVALKILATPSLIERQKSNLWKSITNIPRQFSLRIAAIALLLLFFAGIFTSMGNNNQTASNDPVTNTPSLTKTVVNPTEEPTKEPAEEPAEETDVLVNVSEAVAPPDAYEPDDISAQAQSISPDGTVQEHTFHQDGDSDWVEFEAISGTTYLIEAHVPSDSSADATLELYHQSNTLPQASQDLTFTSDVHLTYKSPLSGTLYLKWFNQDPSAYGDEVAYDLSVQEDPDIPTPGALIVVAGRMSEYDKIYDATNNTYNLFQAYGYPADRIYYLANDLTLDADGDGQPDVDAILNKANLETAITQWAQDKVGPDRPLTLYLSASPLELDRQSSPSGGVTTPSDDEQPVSSVNGHLNGGPLDVLDNDSDIVPPVVEDNFKIDDGALTTTERTVTLDVTAIDPPNSPSGIDALYFVEYEYNLDSGWIPVQSSGWVDYALAYKDYPWTLAPTYGIRFMQVWALDNAGNISRDFSSDDINLLPEEQVAAVAEGEVDFYQIRLEAGQTLSVTLMPITGDPDLSVWGPDNGFWYNHHSREVETVQLEVPVMGNYQIEVHGHTDAEYRLTFGTTETTNPPAEESRGFHSSVNPALRDPKVRLDDYPGELYFSPPSSPVRSNKLSISSVKPSYGWYDVDSSVYIYGDGFEEPLTVTLNFTPLTITNVQPDLIMAQVPLGMDPGLYNVTVETARGMSDTEYSAYRVLEASNKDDITSSSNWLWTEPRTLRVNGAVNSGVGLNLQRLGGFKENEILESVKVDFYLRTARGDEWLGRVEVKFINPNTVVSTPKAIWEPETVGTHTICAKIDPDNEIEEINPEEPNNGEGNNEICRIVTVLDSDPDIVPPVVHDFVIADGAQTTTEVTVTLDMTATDQLPNPRSGIEALKFMEFEYLAVASRWVPVQHSGWVPYSIAHENYPWKLSPAFGLRFMRVWALDNAGNISRDFSSDEINLVPKEEVAAVAEGEVDFYRILVEAGQTLNTTLTPESGDPDLYIWSPRLVRYSNNPSEVDTVQFKAPVTGLYQIEVYGYTDAEYRLTFGTSDTPVEAVQGFHSDSKPIPTVPTIPLYDVPSNSYIDLPNPSPTNSRNNDGSLIVFSDPNTSTIDVVLDGSEEILTSEELNGWLDTLETTAQGVNINIMIDPGNANSFIDLPPAETVNSPEQVIIENNGTSGNGTWTLLIYAAADNNLDHWMGDYEIANGMLHRLRTAGAQENVQVGILYDGPEAGDTGLYMLAEDGSWTEESWYKDEARMDEIETLRNFIEWGYDRFESDYYALALLGHGQGIVGFGQDDTSDLSGEAFLTPLEVREALRDGTNDGSRKLDVLHYEGCGFGLLEDAGIARGLANYMIASPNTGWGIFAYEQYRQLAGSASNPREYATAVAEAYAKEVEFEDLPYTISVFDMAYFEEVNTAVSILGDSLLTYVEGDPRARRDELRAIRDVSQKYDSAGVQGFEIDNEDSTVDIYDFASNLQAELDDQEVTNAATEVQQAIDDAFVIYEEHKSGPFDYNGTNYDADLSDSHGLGIFYPPRSDIEPDSSYQNYVENKLFETTQDSGWTRFLLEALPAARAGGARP